VGDCLDPLGVHQLLHIIQIREHFGMGAEQPNAVEDGAMLLGWSDLEVLIYRGVE
jgi:hypothetical protein